MRLLCLLLLCVLVISASKKNSHDRLRSLRKARTMATAPPFAYCPPTAVASTHPCPPVWKDIAFDPAHPWDDGVTSNACGSLARQSPIPFPPVSDITTPGPFASVTGTYTPAELHGHVINNGHTVKVKIIGDANTLTLTSAVSPTDTRTYHLREFHFHHPSEHHLGSAHDFELHLVHKNPIPAVCSVADMGDAAVAIGILFRVGAENTVLSAILDGVLPHPPHHGAEDTIQAIPEGTTIDLVADLLSTITSFITYPGSLTTPPCSEFVRWLVSPTVLELSQTQLDKFKEVIPDGCNARPMQTHNPGTQPITLVSSVTLTA
jgi:carbonic anhydrase